MQQCEETVSSKQLSKLGRSEEYGRYAALYTRGSHCFPDNHRRQIPRYDPYSDKHPSSLLRSPGTIEHIVEFSIGEEKGGFPDMSWFFSIQAQGLCPLKVTLEGR